MRFRAFAMRHAFENISALFCEMTPSLVSLSIFSFSRTQARSEPSPANRQARRLSSKRRCNKDNCVPLERVTSVSPSITHTRARNDDAVPRVCTPRSLRARTHHFTPVEPSKPPGSRYFPILRRRAGVLRRGNYCRTLINYRGRRKNISIISTG